MDDLSKLPPEVLHSILKNLEPLDLVKMAGCGTALYWFIAENRPLFKEVYLHVLDEPPQRPNVLEFNWCEEVRKYLKATRILQSGMDENERLQHLPFITETLSSWMQTATPKHRGGSLNVKLLTDLFADKSNQETFFMHSTIFGRARRGSVSPSAPFMVLPFLSPEKRQMSAKLHTLYGVPIDLPRRSRFHCVYPFACSVLYDLRNYTEGNFWGPYKNDGLYTVDWERMEAIMIVLGHNLRVFTENTMGVFKPLWQSPWVGASPDSYSPVKLPGESNMPVLPPAGVIDPFNIGGTWIRVVSFLDFSELFAYNFNTHVPGPAPNEPRGPLDTTEAIRLIVMEITVDHNSEPEENDGKELPVVHFKGTSRSMHNEWDVNANSSIKGTVRLTKEGEVRWSSISVYQGEERWKSEGIQVGGVRSSRGVLGHWFDKDHDHHGPAGPTAFWKISDLIERPDEYHPPADEGADSPEEVEVEIIIETLDGEELNMEQVDVEQLVAQLDVEQLAATLGAVDNHAHD